MINELLKTYINQEAKRQEQHLELIASENYVSKAVLECQGSILTNKYAEGYPGKRYYGGCEFVDLVESLAISKACELFDCGYANVQPHSGSSANAAAYAALAQPGSTILGLKLSHGGHLTHGASVNFSGQIYKGVSYELTPDGYLDFNQIEDLAKLHKPSIIVAGFSAYSRQIDWQAFRDIADKVGAFLLADIAHISGLVATNLHPSPLKIADVVTTTTHKTLRGPRGGMILSNNADLYKKLSSTIFPGYQGGPLLHVIAAKAQCFIEALSPEFLQYQQQILLNAKTLSQTLAEEGFPIISGGTDNHLFLVSLNHHSISGKDAETILEKASITLNKNSIPGDLRSPFITSGVRIGTPAVTTRGMKEPQMRLIGKYIAQLLNNSTDHTLLQEIKAAVEELCAEYPVYA